MNILIIVGQNLLANNSASLCHLSYLNGFIATGNNIDVITVEMLESEKKKLPEGPNYFFYKNSNFYHDIYRKIRYHGNNSAIQNDSNESVASGNNKQSKKEIIYKAIQKVLSFRGPYGSLKVWSKRACKYHSATEYDFVLSLSWPSISHYVANNLIKKGRVKCKTSCQLWEDPWALDLYGTVNENIKKEEHLLLRQAQNVLYVTPGTLENQKKIFPDVADKMDWMPLPSYYSKEYPETNNKEKIYSYFGDYFFNVRNLEPFYDAAKTSGIKTYICGNSDKPFMSEEKIMVYPRMSLDKLENFEKETDILVFVSNLGGGQIPGKIYQYSATNKPILFILDGSDDEKKVLLDYFSHFNRYVFCDNTKEDIENAIKKINSNKVTGIANEPVSAFSPKEIAQAIINKM